jgi:hypothetical protein
MTEAVLQRLASPSSGHAASPSRHGAAGAVAAAADG